MGTENDLNTSEELSDLSIELEGDSLVTSLLNDGDIDSNGEESNFGIKPYRFEPELSEDETNENTHQDNSEEEEWRLNEKSWCSCNKCELMPKLIENRCCQEINAILFKMNDLDHELECITTHPGFQTVCLDIWSLQTAYSQYRQQYGHMEDVHGTLERYRHTAYRQLVRFCWGWLGKKNRVILPSCAVNKIRKTFPSNSGEYVGFLPALK